MAARCWHHDPSRRPSFSELKRDLAALVEDPRHAGGFVDLDAFADHGYCYGARGNNNNMTTADTTTAGADDPEVISMWQDVIGWVWCWNHHSYPNFGIMSPSGMLLNFFIWCKTIWDYFDCPWILNLIFFEFCIG